MVYHSLKEVGKSAGSLGGVADVTLVALAMDISPVYAMLVGASVLKFGLLPGFIASYLISFLNESNTKFLIYYDTWYYFRIYWFTFIQKLSNSYSGTDSWYNWKSNRCGSLIDIVEKFFHRCLGGVMMKYRSVFDIIGPVMIGPSSSHTAGAARMGQVARQLFRHEPERVSISLYGSFAKTYQGHGTDVALIGGILGFETDDTRIPDALNIAKERNVEVEFIEEDANAPHPNTAKIRLYKGEEEIEVVACSIGGGKIEVVELNGFDLQLTGTSPALLIVNNDRFGAIAAVASILAKHEINISTMSVSRKEKGRRALMVIETDELLADEVIEEIKGQQNICQVTIMD